jgi:hypothetical protein
VSGIGGVVDAVGQIGLDAERMVRDFSPGCLAGSAPAGPDDAQAVRIVSNGFRVKGRIAANMVRSGRSRYSGCSDRVRATIFKS